MLNNLKIKVCGMKHHDNIKAIDALGVDFIGFIFHQPSKRYIQNEESTQIPETKAERVGVFTYHSLNEITEIAHLFGLKIIQLHGSYSPTQINELKKLGFEVWKCFHVDSEFDAQILTSYSNADAFIFDTAGALLGGNGYVFDWQLLHQMNIARPFLLSGGISPASIQAIKTFNHPQLLGVDLNSQFETEPALKNDSLIQTFINQLQTL